MVCTVGSQELAQADSSTLVEGRVGEVNLIRAAWCVQAGPCTTVGVHSHVSLKRKAYNVH